MKGEAEKRYMQRVRLYHVVHGSSTTPMKSVGSVVCTRDCFLPLHSCMDSEDIAIW